jgi:hypothetical protein
MWGIRTRRPLKKKQTKQILVKQNIKCRAENCAKVYETLNEKKQLSAKTTGVLEKVLRGIGTLIQLCSEK